MVAYQRLEDELNKCEVDDNQLEMRLAVIQNLKPIPAIEYMIENRPKQIEIHEIDFKRP